MATPERTVRVEPREQSSPRNGAAVAALLGAGIGALALGVFVLLNEAGVFSAPTLYGPAGGVTGRTAFATVVWLLAWALLHWRWRDRDVPAGRMFALALLLIAIAIVATFPPVWALF